MSMDSLQARLTEHSTVWDRMRDCRKPVLLYGMGNGAQKLLDECARRGIEVAGVFASDGFVRGHSFAGYPVLRYREARARFGDFFTAIAFASQRPEVLAQFYAVEREGETAAPDLPVAGDARVFDDGYLREHLSSFERAFALLEDEPSRRTFAALVNYKLSGKLGYLRCAESSVDDAYRLLALTGEEDYVDLGAYRGDTVRELLDHTGGRVRSVRAFEPDARNFAHLERNLRAWGLRDAKCYNLGAWSGPGELPFAGKAGRGSALGAAGGGAAPVDSVDRVLGGARVSYLKLDVEGAEREALLGCARTIRRWRPKLCVSAYHRNEDLFALPLLIEQIAPGYRFYLRRFPYVPAWDTNLYCL